MPGGTTVPRETGLTELQRRILEALADLEPPWTLTGGAALAIARLRDLGFEVEPVHGADTFERLRVSQGSDTVVVDLVAEPVDAIESPESVSVGSARIRIDTPHEILVNKLCALLHRSELRDLIDVRALLAGGGNSTRSNRSRGCSVTSQARSGVLHKVIKSPAFSRVARYSGR